MERAISRITPVTLFAYISQMSLIMYFSHERERTYTSKSLFGTVLMYNIVLALIIIVVSEYYGGEKFLISDGDAILYYTEGLKSSNLGFVENVKRISKTQPSDDWGALFFSSFMMSIIPSRFFINAFYVLTGAISSAMLFRMGKSVMPKSYAFLAAMAYGTSSYLVLFHCTTLKESLFVFIIVSGMYSFYRAIIDGKYAFFVGVVLSLFFIVFFRPAVAAFLVISIVAYYAITERGSALSLFLYVMIAGGLVLSLAFLQGQVDHYTAGGDTDKILAESSSGNYSGSFNFFVGWFAALFGPFPTLFPLKDMAKPMNLYGAGLVYKAFLVIPFWLGVLFSVARWNVRIFPMVMFVVAEMAASAMVLASFELRKVVLHMPFVYVIAFYGLSRLKKSSFSASFKKTIELASYAFAAGVLFLWTIIREK